MDKTKIIVVEDNIVYCEFVCNLLAREAIHNILTVVQDKGSEIIRLAKEERRKYNNG